ncbi:MAG TPA: BTAD domain-containing putative transcriptional regulator, partial [Anaeromyxobacteraceae bacterium]|nr:BTAD domain-containing putative transcriptional regulator [Anaeromyxobacteraceae bacterium]
MDTQAQPGGSKVAERPTALLQIHLLGRFEVVRGGAPIPPQAWRRRRPADLLRLVALSPGHVVAREEAIDALWPDKDPASGANNLHRALYDLRQILGGRWVDIERGRISLRREAWVDVDAFERAIEAGGRENWALAVSLYRGDLAPEDRESPWLAPRRAALRGRFAEAAFPRAIELTRAGDAGEAVPLLRRLLGVFPASEEAHRLLMRLLAEVGRRADALRQYDACEAALQAAALGPPGPETRALRDAIQHGQVGASPARAALNGARRASRRLLGTLGPPPLRGRGPAVLLLESLLEQGSGTLVLLGEAGVGKTRLAVEAALLAQARGAAVLCGVGGASPVTVPYGLWADAFREEARAGVHADPLAEAPEPAGASQEERRRAIFESVRGALAEIGAGGPVVLLLDDIHLADESSLNLVHYLAREARALRLVLVCTCREEAIQAGTPIQMALAHLDCERLGRGVRVPRLGLAATREQVVDLVGDAPEQVVAHVYRATDGNPALTEEVARAWRESGRSAVPSDPEAAVRARLSRLGAPAEALLAAAAAAGPRFDLDLVRPVSGLSGHDALSALGACLDAQLLDEDGGGHHFHHALAREAVYRGLGPERRRALHAALADVLEARASQPSAPPASAAIAWHRREADQPELAVRHLVAAG